MQQAETTFNELKEQADLPSDENGLVSEDIIFNEEMRESVLINLNYYVLKRPRKKKVIPIQLWYSEGVFGLGHEKGLDKFKKKLERIIEQSRVSKETDDYVNTRI